MVALFETGFVTFSDTAVDLPEVLLASFTGTGFFTAFVCTGSGFDAVTDLFVIDLVLGLFAATNVVDLVASVLLPGVPATDEFTTIGLLLPV